MVTECAEADSNVALEGRNPTQRFLWDLGGLSDVLKECIEFVGLYQNGATFLQLRLIIMRQSIFGQIKVLLLSSQYEKTQERKGLAFTPRSSYSPYDCYIAIH